MALDKICYEYTRLHHKYLWEGGLKGYCRYGYSQYFENLFPEYNEDFYNLNQDKKVNKKRYDRINEHIMKELSQYSKKVEEEESNNLDDYNYVLK